MMPTTHVKKIWPRYFKEVESGEKTFEIRNDDDPINAFEAGDCILLEEFVPPDCNVHPAGHTGKHCLVEITYVMHIGPTRFGDRTVVLGIRKVEE